ncbi:MAG TPA: CopD family protein, partial [Acidimicrobiia bacterium]|nr:CopD family protein [Acidimicrobiia bacterium]
MLAGVVLPRRRADELSALVPRFSRLAFASVATAVVAGTALLVLLSPRWGALPGSGYGRILALKLGLVGVILASASRAREFVNRQLAGVTSGPTRSPSRIAAPAAMPVPVGVGAVAGAPVHPDAAAHPDAPAGPGPEWDGRADPVALRPFVTAVTAELCLAAGVLAATTLLVGRSPPS